MTIKIGIRAHDLGRFPPGELARNAKTLGFEGLQLVLSKAFPEDWQKESPETVRKDLGDLPVFLLGAYFNPVHPDPLLRERGISEFRRHLRMARILGAPFVGTETGSLRGTPWTYLPENHLPETFERVAEVFSGLVGTAEEAGSCVAVEGAWAHVVHSPASVRELLDRIRSPRLKVIVDLFNFLHPGNEGCRMEIFEECLRLFSEDIVVWHLKDYVPDGDVLRQVPLGKGKMDFPAMIERIHAATPDSVLVFEGVTGEDILPSLSFIRHLIPKE